MLERKNGKLGITEFLWDIEELTYVLNKEKIHVFCKNWFYISFRGNWYFDICFP